MEEIVNEAELDYIECVACSNQTLDCEATDTDDGLVCERCLEHYCSCSNCSNKFHTDNMLSADGEIYCENCYDDLPYCDRCEERSHDLECSSIYVRNGNQESWCESCIDNHSFYCERCNENYSSSNHCSTYVERMGTLCEECCEDVGTFNCQECDNIWSMDDCFNDEDDSDDYICTRCAGNGARHIHNYSYKPSPIYKLATNQPKKDNLFFGIELEVERKDSETSTKDMASQIVNENVYYLKSDGSLSCGFEIVTHPLTFEYIQEHKESIFKPLLDKLISAGYRSYDSDTCGIHIHLSKNCFSTWQLYRFIKFFIENRGFVTAISQRQIEQLDRWATIEEESNESIIYKAKKKDGNNKRYSAVNLQNSKTIEIRIFRGTLNYMSFLKNIEFCYALFNFSRDCKDTSVNSFKQYIEQSNEYAMLKKFIKTKNL